MIRLLFAGAPFMLLASSPAASANVPGANGLSDAQVSSVVARLREAQAQARGNGRLSFDLKCSDEQESGICADGGRKALATLPLEKIQTVAPIYNTTCVRGLFEYPEDACPASVQGEPRRIDAYEISLPLAAGNGLTWKVGIAPADGLQTIVLERGLVIYH